MIVILILTTISTFSGIDVIKNAKLTTFTTEMKIMQLQINSIYEKYTNGDTISIDNNNYTGEDILNIGSQKDNE